MNGVGVNDNNCTKRHDCELDPFVILIDRWLFSHVCLQELRAEFKLGWFKVLVEWGARLNFGRTVLARGWRVTAFLVRIGA